MSVDNPLGIFNNRMLHLEEQSMLFDLTKVGNDGDVDVVRGLTLEDVIRLHAAIGEVIASYSTPKTLITPEPNTKKADVFAAAYGRRPPSSE